MPDWTDLPPNGCMPFAKAATKMLPFCNRKVALIDNVTAKKETSVATLPVPHLADCLPKDDRGISGRSFRRRTLDFRPRLPRPWFLVAITPYPDDRRCQHCYRPTPTRLRC